MEVTWFMLLETQNHQLSEYQENYDFMQLKFGLDVEWGEAVSKFERHHP